MTLFRLFAILFIFHWLKKTVHEKDEIVINVGDMLSRDTNNKLKSTIHKVINPPKELWKKSRYSIPFFLHPAPSVNLKSIFNDEDQGILANEFLNQRLKEIKLY